MRTVMYKFVLPAKSRSQLARAVLCAVIAALCLGAWSTASAQQDVGYIFGTVTDQTGAAVPNAKVIITRQATALAQSIATNETGYYVSQPLQVGPYTVSVDAAGFTPTIIRNLEVDAAARVQANVTLHVGSASANITVQDTP
ncbi:MAG: carboxypeptidase-like regulatory domain-containing protein, partial [Acidobacteriaceae bacterium]|nr:carboxypeptidase-like regulatory domain-containing protein [Acidobacteriaceae bacterium]